MSWLICLQRGARLGVRSQGRMEDHSEWEEGKCRGKEREKGSGGRDKTKRRGGKLKVDFIDLLEAGEHVPAKGWVSLG